MSFNRAWKTAGALVRSKGIIMSSGSVRNRLPLNSLPDADQVRSSLVKMVAPSRSSKAVEMRGRG